jgi:hypothetical protein
MYMFYGAYLVEMLTEGLEQDAGSQRRKEQRGRQAKAKRESAQPPTVA